MENKAKLSIYIEELKPDGPITVIDAEIGKNICEYVKLDKIIDCEETKKLKEAIEKHVINWWICRGFCEKKFLDFSDEDNKHKVDETETRLFGEISLPFSYHTFHFPFLWNDGSKVKTRKKFTTCLNPHWKKDDNIVPDELFTEKYNQYHYFNVAARNAIYSNNDDDNAIVWNYKYNLANDNEWLHSKKDGNNKAKYVIKINEKEEYELAVNGIRLKLFNTGIGILTFELENYKYSERTEITRINDFGRRIYMPFSAGNDRACFQCAQQIHISYEGQNIFEDKKGLQNPETFDTTRIAAPIMALLSNGEYSITTDKNDIDKNHFYIEPVIDDRMYVACYCLDNKIATEMQVWNDGNYAYINDITDKDLEPKKKDNTINLASEIYKLVYIDGNGLTCQSKSLLSEMLGKKYIYDRWIEYGSLTGITEYSMVTITNSSADYLARNFLTEYVEMSILALAQRASLLNFERRISDSTLKKSDIRDIHKEYILFQSQLLLKEVTPQQQGIELYKMMIDNLFINEQVAEIENQIEDAFAQKTADNESRENFILFILAILSIFEATNTFWPWFFPDISNCTKAIIASVFCAFAVIWYVIIRKK